MGRKTEGRIFQRGKKGTYYLQYYLNGKEVRRRLLDDNGNPVTNKREAEKAKERELAPVKTNDHEQRRRQVADAYRNAKEVAQDAKEKAKPKTPISEMWERNPWDTNTRGGTERKLSASTIEDNYCQWKKFPEWADTQNIRYAEDVTPDHAETFQKYLIEQKLSGDRVNKCIMCAKVMFDLSGIEPNPFANLRRRHHKAQGRRELTTDELHAVCQNATGELRTLLAIGLYTGLRLKDACNIKWGEINEDLSRIILQPSKIAYKDNSEVVLPVHPVLQAILAETPEHERQGPVLPDFSALYARDRGEASRVVQRHLKKQGIKLHKDPEKKNGQRVGVDVGFHSLRHSFVSICARQGVPLHVVRSLCGQYSPQVQRLYLHNSVEDFEQAIATLPSVSEDENKSEEQELREKAAELVKTADIASVKQFLENAEE